VGILSMVEQSSEYKCMENSILHTLDNPDILSPI